MLPNKPIPTLMHTYAHATSFLSTLQAPHKAYREIQIMGTSAEWCINTIKKPWLWGALQDNLPPILLACEVFKMWQILVQHARSFASVVEDS